MWIAGAAVVAAGLVGIGIGSALGGGDGEDRISYVTDTVTVAETAERRTVTRTVTVEAEDPFADTTTDDDPSSSSTTDEGGEDCSDDYAGACIPDTGERVTCSDLPESDFDVLGEDVYGLDPDGDGIACET